VSRDRDEAGRPRNARPRDALGRPQPRGGDGQPPADLPALPPAAALEEAQRLLDDGRAFAAHEVLEATWKAAPGPERALWRGLAQLAVGLTHRARGNERGAAALLRRGADTLDEVEGRPHGVAVDELRHWARAAADTPVPMPRLRGQAADERA
jgi:hypothetical protein